jgi:hypothetical protein
VRASRRISQPSEQAKPSPTIAADCAELNQSEIFLTALRITPQAFGTFALSTTFNRTMRDVILSITKLILISGSWVSGKPAGLWVGLASFWATRMSLLLAILTAHVEYNNEVGGKHAIQA